MRDRITRPIATPFRPTAAHRAGSYTAARACPGRAGWQSFGHAERPGHVCLTPPRPEEPGELSSREKEILAAIEQEIQTTDPTLARHMARRKRLKARTPLRAAVRHGTLLIIALVILIVATAVLPSDSWIIMGLLTTVLLVPWILLFPPTACPRAEGRRLR